MSESNEFEKNTVPLEFRKAIATGTKRQQLEALRDLLAKALTQSKRGEDTSSLALRLTKVLEELRNLPDETATSRYDELAAARDEKLGGSKSAARRQGGRRRRGGGAV